MRTIKLLPAVAMLVAGAAVPATAQAAETDATMQAAEYYTGQAFGIAASVDLLGPIVVPAQPDTGAISTAVDLTTDTACTASVDAIVADVEALCPSVTVDTAAGTVVSETTIEGASVNLLGAPAIAIEDLTVTAAASCEKVSGDTDLTLRIGDQVILVDDPNVSIEIPGGEVVVNQQKPTDSGIGIDVTAVVVKLDGIADIEIGHAEAAAHGCLTAPPQS
ncbi:choice-of-anchor P family protein [Myceligenerans indicum]|uniref:Uncharacterized protein n=1 Tax=Myceligenerans indicum TaxID=2593663 RepID=A0ABS1LRY4_9MICO|nr:choice-of-anchor P family protein [Myceligenerans indicum]MBL0888543.1 hypothetical protein [Myceligenerans indicum]